MSTGSNEVCCCFVLQEHFEKVQGRIDEFTRQSKVSTQFLCLAGGCVLCQNISWKNGNA